jgi:hypothetical protein
VLDLVPGGFGPAYAGWIDSRGQEVHERCVKVVNAEHVSRLRQAIRDELQDAVAVLDVYCVV